MPSEDERGALEGDSGPARTAGRSWWDDLLDRVAAGDARLVVSTPAGAEAVLVSKAWLDGVELRSSAAAEAAGTVRLSARELEVLGLMDGGLTATAVAGRLGIAVNTVHQHLTMVRRKLGVRTTGEAVAAAWAAGMLLDGVPRPGPGQHGRV